MGRKIRSIFLIQAFSFTWADFVQEFYTELKVFARDFNDFQETFVILN